VQFRETHPPMLAHDLADGVQALGSKHRRVALS
jgi:hypothetical protein